MEKVDFHSYLGLLAGTSIANSKAHHWAAQDMRQCQLRQLHGHRRDEYPKRLIGGWPHEAFPPRMCAEPQSHGFVIVVVVLLLLLLLLGGGGGGRFCDISLL